MELALYLHFPFCKQKCFYCDFNSYSGREDLIPDYCEALLTEIERNLPSQHRIRSIYFGGGTPSLVPAEFLAKLLQLLKTNTQTSARTEITIEANPGTLHIEALLQLKEAGFNRLSLGLQAVQNDLLRHIGRIHRYEEFENIYYLAREVGFTNLNVDLIFGLPGQNPSAWEETLTRVAQLKPEHISAYGLQLEHGTPLERTIAGGALQMPDEEETVEMMRTAMRFLPEKGWEQYEISNYARPGFQSVHNLAYWMGLDYLGFGAGATSTIYGERRTNVKEPAEYIDLMNQGKPVAATRETIDPQTAAIEAVMLGLRLRRGIGFAEFREQWGINLPEKLGVEMEGMMARNLVKVTDQRLCLTDSGILLSNEVISRLIQKL